MATPSQHPTPATIFDALTAYERSACLRGAIDLNLFTTIGEGADTAPAIANRIGATERGVRILCDFLTADGFLLKNNDRYALTQESAMFLDRRSPAYIGTMSRFLGSARQQNGFRDVAELVRKGHTLDGEGATSPEDPMWVEFARSMAPMMAQPAQAIAALLGAESGQSWKVLDIAAGHGLYGITIAERNPNAQIFALDWASVLAVAQENAEKHGVSARYHQLPGSAFEVELGSGYDVVLLTNFVHHFDPATNESLLRKIRAALKPEGRLVTLEFVPNPDRVSPPFVAKFAMIMLAGTPGGDAYTFAELDRMLRNTGFTRNQAHPVPPGMETAILSQS